MQHLLYCARCRLIHREGDHLVDAQRHLQRLRLQRQVVECLEARRLTEQVLAARSLVCLDRVASEVFFLLLAALLVGRVFVRLLPLFVLQTRAHGWLS